MSITNYSRYRRLKLRQAWPLAGMTEWLLNVGTYVAGFVLILGFLQWADAQNEKADRAEVERIRHELRADRHEQTILSCLNNKGFWLDGVLQACSILDTKFVKGDFK